MTITIEVQVTWGAPSDADVGDEFDDQHKQQVIQELEQCLISTLSADKPESIIRGIPYLVIY